MTQPLIPGLDQYSPSVIAGLNAIVSLVAKALTNTGDPNWNPFTEFVRVVPDMMPHLEEFLFTGPPTPEETLASRERVKNWSESICNMMDTADRTRETPTALPQ